MARRAALPPTKGAFGAAPAPGTMAVSKLVAIAATLTSLTLAAGAAAAQDAPLSGVDWLDPVAPITAAVPLTPDAGTVPDPDAAPEPPVAGTARTPDVDVRPLDAPSVSSVGLLPPHVTGLPLTLWRGSDGARVAALLAEVPVDRLPPLQALLFSLLLAEADPPADARGEALLLARLDRLMAQGAVAPALALVERAGSDSPERFRRWFDLMLLTGETDLACARLLAAPHLGPGLEARIYCLGLTGDWPAADAALSAARTLGSIPAKRAELLALFLDPELAEELRAPRLAAAAMTPLDYRLLQALGEAPSPSGLPRSFATLVVTGDAGWRTQIEAAERLARAGSVPPNSLIGIYSERKAAASGGVWDRVAAVQRLDRALAAGNPDKVADTLPTAWRRIRAAGLEAPFAALFAEPLAGMALEGRTASLARDILYLSPDYEGAAALYAQTPASDIQQFMAGVARGAPEAARNDLQAAIAAAFSEQEAPAGLAAMVAGDRLGEAIMVAMAATSRGAEGDLVALQDGLTRLRALGLEDTARRAALFVLAAGANTP